MMKPDLEIKQKNQTQHAVLGESNAMITLIQSSVLVQLAQTSKDPTEGWEVGFRNGFLEG